MFLSQGSAERVNQGAHNPEVSCFFILSLVYFILNFNLKLNLNRERRSGDQLGHELWSESENKKIYGYSQERGPATGGYDRRSAATRRADEHEPVCGGALRRRHAHYRHAVRHQSSVLQRGAPLRLPLIHCLQSILSSTVFCYTLFTQVVCLQMFSFDYNMPRTQLLDRMLVLRAFTKGQTLFTKLLTSAKLIGEFRMDLRTVYNQPGNLTSPIQCFILRRLLLLYQFCPKVIQFTVRGIR